MSERVYRSPCPNCGADPRYHDDAAIIIEERAHHYLLMCCRCGVDSVLDRWGRPA